jgi:lipooligosaccharide transport system permease protein
VLPLWHGVELLRGLTTGSVSVALLGHVAYFVIVGAIGVGLATTRLKKLFFT